MSAPLIPFPAPPAGPPPAAPAVPVRFGELLAACGPGAGAGRMWVDDFADEPVLVSADLAEVLHAAGHLAAGSFPAGPAAAFPAGPPTPRADPARFRRAA